MSRVLPSGVASSNQSSGSENAPWDDVLGPISPGTAVSAPTIEEFGTTPFRTTFLRHDQNDEIHWSFQIPHGWLPGSEARFHLHLVPMADPATAKNVRFDGYYFWSSYGEAIPTDEANWTPFTADYTVNPGDGLKQTIISVFAATPPAEAKESSILLVYCRRAGTDNADTYTDSKADGTGAANLCILSSDIHIQREKEGTLLEYPT